MVEEIVYTSAEKGLKQGSRGFCTVVSTAGMSLALAERLESMSGYRHAFPLHDPQASLNPVCFSHVTTRLAGKSLHVISRVADAGQDYTGRSNKLAHHLVIDNVASMPAGPARLMAEPGVIVERWDGNVRNVPPRELRCAPLPVSIPLVAWQSLTGDEGWAGSVAEQLLQNPAPVSIIFKPGTDTLTLVREVLDLIPAPQRWNVTFSTYFTRMLAGAECQLRFVLNDTPEATSLRNDARARVIDLTSSLPAASGGTLVAMARKGQLTAQEPAPIAAAQAVRSRTAAEISIKETVAEASIPRPKPGLTPLATPDKPQPPRDLPPPVRGNSRKGLWIGLTAAMILVTVTGILIFLRPGKNNDPFADLVNKTVPPEQRQAEAEEARIAKERAEKGRLEQIERDRLKELESEEAMKAKEKELQIEAAKVAAMNEAERRSNEEKELRAKAAIQAELVKEGPFAFIRKGNEFKDQYGQWMFNLPAITSAESDASIPLRLSKGTHPSKVTLSLCDAASSLFANCAVTPLLKQLDEDSKRWQVTAGKDVIAEYWLEEVTKTDLSDVEANSFIRFKWLKAAVREAPVAETLRWWPLQVDVDDRTAVFIQRGPSILSTPLKWSDLTEKRAFPFPMEGEVKHLSMDRKLGLSIQLTVRQTDQPDQIMSLTLKDKESDGDERDTLDTSGVDPYPPLENRSYFLLDVPLRLVPEIPKDVELPLVIGIMDIRPSIDRNDGLSIKSDIQIQARIPQKEYVASLPGPRFIADLDRLAAQPNLFYSQVAEAINDENNAATNWPRLKGKFDAAMLEMKNNSMAFQSSPSFWHSQGLHSLPSLKQFTSPFRKKAKVAIIEVNKLLPAYELAYKNSKTPLAESELKRAREYSTAVSIYGNLLNGALQEVDATIEVLMKDYKGISDKISGFESASTMFSVRVSLLKSFEIPAAESGKELRLYIVESDSASAP